MKKWIKILLVTLGIIAVLVVTTILLLPPIAKNYLEKHSKELVGRQITIEKLRFNVLNGKLRIDQIAMLEPDDSTTFASLGNFYTRIHLLPLLRQRIHIDAVLIDKPYLNVYQDGTSFNFDDLLTRFLTPADTVEKAPSNPWTVDIDDIKIHNGELTYKDMQRNVTWGFNELDIDVPGLHLSGHERTDMGIVFNFSRGGSLRTSLEYDQATADYDLSLLLSNLSLAGTAAYFNQVIDIGSVEGLVTLDLHVKGNANHLLDLRTYGIAAASGLKLRDSRDNRIIDVDTLNFDLRDGNLGTMQYDIRRIYAAGIRTQFEIYRGGGNNLLALIKAPEERPTETEATIDGETTVTIEREEPATTQLNFTVGELLLDKGEIAFTDNTFEKPFRYLISDIRLSSRDIDFSKQNELTLDAKLQRTGSGHIRWKGSLQNLDNHNLMVALSNINLKDFTPYCEHFTAYPLTGGNLTFRSQNIIADRFLNGTNHLDIFQCEVDKKRKDLEPEFKIPLKLGLYILKDRKGHVKIDLPVKGNLDSPEFSYRKIVMKALGNVLLKVVTAPFSFLTGGGDNLDRIEVDPLQFSLNTDQYATLDKVADILRDKPEMQIGLAQRINRSKAVGRLAELNLKMACYNSTLPAGERLSMIDFERIQETKLKSDEVMRFADSLLALRRHRRQQTLRQPESPHALRRPGRRTARKNSRPPRQRDRRIPDPIAGNTRHRDLGTDDSGTGTRRLHGKRYLCHPARYGGREHRRNGRQYGRRYGNNGYIGFRDGGSPRDCTGTGGGTTHANRNCEGNGDSRTFRSDGNSDAVHPGRDYDHRIRGRNYDDKNPDSTSGRAANERITGNRPNKQTT